MKANNVLFGLSTFFIALLLISFVSACDTPYGVFKQGTSISLINTCTSCNGINASIVYPDGTQTGSFSFQNINNVYNYTFTNTTQLGTYNVIGLDAWCYNFDVTPNGKSLSQAESNISSNSVYFILFLGIIFIIFGMFSLNKGFWITWLGVFFISIGFILLYYDLSLVNYYIKGITASGSTVENIFLMFAKFLKILPYITALIIGFTIVQIVKVVKKDKTSEDGWDNNKY